jgi:hypothetical protein
MNVIPASKAAWMVAMARASSGRPSMEMGIPPKPIAETVTSPMVRVFILIFLLGLSGIVTVYQA